MFGLVVIEVMTLSGHLSNINEINPDFCAGVPSLVMYQKKNELLNLSRKKTM